MSPEYAAIPLKGARQGADGAVEGLVHLPKPWRLHYGDTLADARVAYRLVGPAEAPVIAALGGISAHRVVAGPEGEGWWSEVVGPGLAVDTGRYRVLGMDFLGGSGASSIPESGQPFPPLSTFDQAAALREVLRDLRLPCLHAIIGASYGGMVATSFALRYPECLNRMILLCTTDKAPPLSTAWRSVQRQIVREALARGDGPAGLRLARALAMTTYRSPAEFAQRFAAPPVRSGNRFRFAVEDYLFARGDHYAQQYRAECFLVLSESIDLHDVDAGQVRTPATLIAIQEDQLVPRSSMQEFAARLGGPCRFVELSSIYGHDGFLKEGAALAPLIKTALAENT